MKQSNVRKNLRRILKPLVLNDRCWGAIRNSLGLISHAYLRMQGWREGKEISEEFLARCERVFSELTVLNGPFKGMRYPSLKACGSALFPKLIGSYERELENVIGYIINQPYDSIVDIGCAEGYYAIGLGRRMSGARIFAYDTSKAARELCGQMAELNGVKITLGGLCDKNTLMGLDLGGRALILADCEGYENSLFDRASVACLRRHDFLIESHDFIDIRTTRRLMSVFGETHAVETVASVDDIIKAYQYDLPEAGPFDLDERRRLFGEGRPGIMRWLFARSKCV